MKGALKIILKAAISIALMALLLLQIDFAELAQAVASIDWVLFALAGALFFLQQGFVAYCWQILLLAQDNRVPFGRVLKVHFIGNFFGVFMPTSIGMDIVRAYSLSRHMRKGMDAVSSLFLSRVVGYLVFFALAIVVALPVARQTENDVIFWVVSVSAVAFAVCVWLFFHPAVIALAEKGLAKIRLERIGRKLGSFHKGIKLFRQRKRALMHLLAWTVFYQVLGISVLYLVGISLGIEVGLVYYFIYTPVIMAITMLPISLGGIGTREWAFVAFFTPLGASQAQALSLSLLLFALGVAVALFGGILYLASTRSAAARTESESVQSEQMNETALPDSSPSN